MSEERRKTRISKTAYEAEKRVRVQETFKLDPTVIITLRSKDFLFEFTNEALIGILTDTGKNLMGEALTVKDLTQPSMMESVMWWGLHSNQPELTREQCGRLYTMRHFLAIQGSIGQALSLFMPEMSEFEVEEEETLVTSENPTLP